jgi:virulence-associated protein VagC
MATHILSANNVLIVHPLSEASDLFSSFFSSSTEKLAHQNKNLPAEQKKEKTISGALNGEIS